MQVLIMDFRPTTTTMTTLMILSCTLPALVSSLNAYGHAYSRPVQTIILPRTCSRTLLDCFVPHNQRPPGAVACGSRFLLTRALLMASSHSAEGQMTSRLHNTQRLANDSPSSLLRKPTQRPCTYAYHVAARGGRSSAACTLPLWQLHGAVRRPLLAQCSLVVSISKQHGMYYNCEYNLDPAFTPPSHTALTQVRKCVCAEAFQDELYRSHTWHGAQDQSRQQQRESSHVSPLGLTC